MEATESGPLEEGGRRGIRVSPNAVVRDRENLDILHHD